MGRESRKKQTQKYINEFPIIIILAVAIILIVLINITLGFKPYSTVSKDGYMIRSNNMTYNLVSNINSNNDLNINTVKVNEGDYLYKKSDNYYVGAKEQTEIEINYPIYSTDGLTIYNTNENVKLINSKFEKFQGYKGLSINYGVLYNDGDDEPADRDIYIFLNLEDSIFINTQIINIYTNNSIYTIPINSPIFFNTKYINFYSFDGEKFNYNKVSDIYYDSVVNIGSISMSYEDFLLRLGLMRLKDIDGNEIEDSSYEKPIEDKKIINVNEYIKPTVSATNFSSKVYSIGTTVTISDPSGVITTEPTFELYDDDNKLVLRKKAYLDGTFRIQGLSSNTNYKIVGTYKYQNKSGMSVAATFYEGSVTTKTIDSLDEIKISLKSGDRYPDRLELKDFKILNHDSDAIEGIKNIHVVINKHGSEDETVFSIPYNKLVSITHGDAADVITSNNLSSNTVYDYRIEFYDKDENILKCTGDIDGIIKTSKKIPSILYQIDINRKNNNVELKIDTKNPDDINIENYEYKLYSYLGTLVSEGTLDSSDDSIKTLNFDSLDYNQNYVLRITGIYDLEDGNGLRQLESYKEFSTINLDSDFVAYYDEKSLNVTEKTIEADIFIGSQVNVLQRDDTKLVVYLADENGDDILDEDGNLKYYIEYSKDEYTQSTGVYHVKPLFENLNPNAEYIIRLRIDIKQIDNNMSISKSLYPKIKTKVIEPKSVIINSKLIGDNLNLKFKLDDPNSVLKNNIIVEVYEGKFESIDKINKLYLYRNSYNYELAKDEIEVSLNDCNSDEYTIVVYENSKIKRYIYLYSDDDSKKIINVDRTANARTEVYEQIKYPNEELDTETKININYNLGNTKTNLFLIDCVGSLCTNLGYLNTSDEFINISSNVSYKKVDNDSNVLGVVTILSNDDTRQQNWNYKSKNHKFYITIERPQVDLTSGITNFNESSIYNGLYVLDSLDYTTEYELINLSKPSEFITQGKIANNNETRHYVVTKDIDFSEEKITKARIKNFKGEIDFQGHSVYLYKTSNSQFHLFDSISSNGVLKNMVLNYTIDTDAIISALPGFVNKNYGTIKDVIINVEQLNSKSEFYAGGLLAEYNYGTIENFVAYLKTNLYTYSASTILTYINYASGKIRNGYIVPNQELLEDVKVILSEANTYHGTFTRDNHGLIENVYNLVSVVYPSDGYTSTRGAMTVANKNMGSGTIRNTLSVATTTQNGSRIGPNVGTATGKLVGNYYVDINKNNLNYVGTQNIKIGLSSLKNKGVLEVILNKDNVFTISSGYYPVLKMSNFMSNMQPLIEIYGGRDSSVDIISGQNIENTENKAIVYVGNPGGVVITNLIIEDLSSRIIDQKYNESTQVTELTLEINVDDRKGDKAKNRYLVSKIEYEYCLVDDSECITKSRTYNSSDVRVLDIEMYRKVTNYNDLVDYLNNNENIILSKDIRVSTSKLPDDVLAYSAIFDGNGKTLDFNNENISRGYFLYLVSGTIRNLKIKNYYAKSSVDHLAPIYKTVSAIIDNVDVEGSKLIVDGNSTTINVGCLIGEDDSSTISRVSSNDCDISQSAQAKSVTNIRIGGLIGVTSNDTIFNSYAYNLNIHDLPINTYRGSKSIGGLVGYMKAYSSISDCYSSGKIDTEYDNVGGIAGLARLNYIINSYSNMNIRSTGDYVGGIVGKIQENSYYSNSIKNNMFIGEITNVYNKPNYSDISATNLPVFLNESNYVIDSDDLRFSSIDFDNLTAFDDEGQFMVNESSDHKYLPYLLSSSFAEQKIKDDYYGKNSLEKIEYSFEYNIDNTCKNTLINQGVLSEDDNNPYKYACATSAILTIPDNYLVRTNNSKLNITKSGDSYIISPNSYADIYNIELEDDNEVIDLEINIPFYRHVDNQEKWNEISTTETENVLLLSNVILNNSITNSTNKKINKLLGSKYYIGLENDSVDLKKPLIINVNTMLRDLSFIGLKNTSNANYSSIIQSNFGSISNVSFKDINIVGKSYTGIISNSSGKVENINLDNITIKGNNYTGGLVGYSDSPLYSQYFIEHVAGENVKVTGNKYVGGILGYAYYGVNDVEATDFTVEGVTYVGGIYGYGNAVNASIVNSNITASSDYAAGIGASQSYSGYEKYNVSVSDTLISNTGTSAQFYGGAFGAASYVRNASISNVKLCNLDIDGVCSNLNVKSVGGVVGSASHCDSCKVYNSRITGQSQVGGIIGSSRTDSKQTTTKNLLYDSSVVGSSGVGGIFGYYGGMTQSTPYLVYNMVLSSNISGDKYVGGIVGNLENSTTVSQRIELNGNFAFGDTIIGNSSVGGLIGSLKQVPQSAKVTYKNSLFYGNVVENNIEKESLIGEIVNKNTGSSSGYGTNIIEEEFYELSNFKRFVASEIINSYQINTINDIDSLVDNIGGSIYSHVFSETQIIDEEAKIINYFPIFNELEGESLLIRDENSNIISKVAIPDSYSSSLQSPRGRRSIVKGSNTMNTNINYDVYVSDVDKFNIDFYDVDSNVSFYYKIGNYISDIIPVTKRTYTISYDFNNPITIFIKSGNLELPTTYEAANIRKTLSVVNGKTYYLMNGLLYSEDKVITGQFVNLYNDNVLTSDGKIYNINTKKENDANITYHLFEYSKPIYEFSYDGEDIKTYYNYSLVNDIYKEYQLFVKNGILNVINNSVNNKRDSYIIDYFNNNEIQVVLKNDGILYSLKDGIKYPSDFKNHGISELYVENSSNKSIVSLKYESGLVYSFDYITGNKIFDNSSKSSMSFIDFIKEKLFSDSDDIPNITSYEKYTEINILKDKIEDISIDEAILKLRNDNSSKPESKKYITVYNDITKNYDIYDTSEILGDNSIALSETDKIYKDYELVEFYNNGTPSKKKNNLNGIIMFGIPIIAILISLYLLIRKKKAA